MKIWSDDFTVPSVYSSRTKYIALSVQSQMHNWAKYKKIEKQISQHLTMQPWLTQNWLSLNAQRLTYLYLPGAGIKGM